MKTEWISVKKMMPEQNVFVKTKIDDGHGVRNIQELKLVGRLWFTKDGTYVYYTPTHFAKL